MNPRDIQINGPYLRLSICNRFPTYLINMVTSFLFKREFQVKVGDTFYSPSSACWSLSRVSTVPTPFQCLHTWHFDTPQSDDCAICWWHRIDVLNFGHHQLCLSQSSTSSSTRTTLRTLEPLRQRNQFTKRIEVITKRIQKPLSPKITLNGETVNWKNTVKFDRRLTWSVLVTKR